MRLFFCLIMIVSLMTISRATAQMSDADIEQAIDGLDCILHELDRPRQVVLDAQNAAGDREPIWAFVNAGPSSALIYVNDGNRVEISRYSGNVDLFVGDGRFKYSVGAKEGRRAKLYICTLATAMPMMPLEDVLLRSRDEWPEGRNYHRQSYARCATVNIMVRAMSIMMQDGSLSQKMSDRIKRVGAAGHDFDSSVKYWIGSYAVTGWRASSGKEIDAAMASFSEINDFYESRYLDDYRMALRDFETCAKLEERDGKLSPEEWQRLSSGGRL